MKNQICIFCGQSCNGTCQAGFNKNTESRASLSCGGQGCNCGNTVTAVIDGMVKID